ncbi:putative leucine-rich repeat-containing protein DDB_G0290503 isoform X2 [Centruroides vittatus]|uniref:putative leucine-rich repeat-containing protein DDB_G0290503 isoform X2 n=1 Tax=Centruroides vittatus TaxID=120091 RepID=UPI00350F6F95
MLTHKEGKRRPASMKIPTTKWQDQHWPPPLNLSPLNQRRNSDTGNFPVILKKENKSDDNQNKSEVDILTKRKSSSAKCSMGKCENINDRKIEKYRTISEINFLDIKTDLDRLKKDKRIMANLLKESQKELTKKESQMKGIIQENEVLKKEIVSLKALKLKTEEKKSENTMDNLIIATDENKEELKTSDNTEKITLLESNKKIALLTQENQILKECLNNIYCKILDTDSLETENIQTETKQTLENSLINSEIEIEKINEYVERILKQHDKLTRKIEEYKKIPQSSAADSNEKIKSIEEDKERLMQEVGTKENEIKTLSELNDKLKDSMILTESRYEDLEKEIIDLQIDNNKLEEFLLVCRKAQKELRSSVKNWEEKFNIIEGEKHKLEMKITKVQDEFDNFKMNIMETIRLALDIEPLESTVPTDVLTMAIVEMAEECHALRTTVERIERKENEQIQQLNKLYSYILETEKKLENDGRDITSLQNVICKLSLIAVPNISLEEAIIKIYSNTVEREKNILNKLSSLGISAQGEMDILCILDSIKSQNIIEHVQISSDQSVQDVNDKNDFVPIKLTNETTDDLKNENNFDVNEIESNNFKEMNKIMSYLKNSLFRRTQMNL